MKEEQADRDIRLITGCGPAPESVRIQGRNVHRRGQSSEDPCQKAPSRVSKKKYCNTTYVFWKNKFCDKTVRDSNILVSFFNSTFELPIAARDTNYLPTTIMEELINLKNYVASKRDSFDTYEKQGEELSGSSDYMQTETQHKRRNVLLNPLDFDHAEEIQILKNTEQKVSCLLSISLSFLSTNVCM